MERYKTKWSDLNRNQRFQLSKELEDKFAKFLEQYCGFVHIIPTRDSVVTIAKQKGLILPDLMGLHNNGEEYFLELKNKNRRMDFNDNGVDVKKAEAYLEISKVFNKKVLVAFIDDETEWKINYPYIDSWFKDYDGNCTYYGNWIEKLYLETPENAVTITQHQNSKIICFPLRNMRKLVDIFSEKQTQLNFGVIK